MDLKRRPCDVVRIVFMAVMWLADVYYQSTSTVYQSFSFSPLLNFIFWGVNVFIAQPEPLERTRLFVQVSLTGVKHYKTCLWAVFDTVLQTHWVALWQKRRFLLQTWTLHQTLTGFLRNRAWSVTTAESSLNNRNCCQRLLQVEAALTWIPQQNLSLTLFFSSGSGDVHPLTQRQSI